MKSINPATGELIKEYSEYSPMEVENIIGAVDYEWQSWKTTLFEERAKLMHKASEILLALHQQPCCLLDSKIILLLSK